MTGWDENFIVLQMCFWKLNVVSSNNCRLLNIKKQENSFSSTIDVTPFLSCSWQKMQARPQEEKTCGDIFTSNVCSAARAGRERLRKYSLHNEEDDAFLERLVSTATGAVRQKAVFRRREQSPCSHECPYTGRPDRSAGWKNRGLSLPVR